MRESTVVAKWKAEGFAEGRAQGIRSVLREVLGQKFGVPVPSDLVSILEAQAESDVLLHWLSLAVAAGSLDDFRRTIL